MVKKTESSFCRWYRWCTASCQWQFSWQLRCSKMVFADILWCIFWAHFPYQYHDVIHIPSIASHFLRFSYFLRSCCDGSHIGRNAKHAWTWFSTSVQLIPQSRLAQISLPPLGKSSKYASWSMSGIVNAHFRRKLERHNRVFLCGERAMQALLLISGGLFEIIAESGKTLKPILFIRSSASGSKHWTGCWSRVDKSHNKSYTNVNWAYTSSRWNWACFCIHQSTIWPSQMWTVR